MEQGGPGWNDPPNLAYQVKSSHTGRRNLLNKRVSYLTNPPSTNSVKTIYDPSQPPPMTKHNNQVNQESVDKEIPCTKNDSTAQNIFNPNKPNQDSSDEGCEMNVQSSSYKTESDANFAYAELDLIANLFKLNEQLAEKDAAEISKKLNVLKSMTENKSISQVVLDSMNQLVKHLLMKSYDKAWEIHVSLMCDHVTEVRQWMVGIKKLINALRKT